MPLGGNAQRKAGIEFVEGSQPSLIDVLRLTSTLENG